MRQCQYDGAAFYCYNCYIALCGISDACDFKFWK